MLNSAPTGFIHAVACRPQGPFSHGICHRLYAWSSRSPEFSEGFMHLCASKLWYRNTGLLVCPSGDPCKENHHQHLSGIFRCTS